MAYKRKTCDEYQLWGNWGYGWDYILAESSLKEAREQMRCYRKNDARADYRIIKKRIKLTEVDNDRQTESNNR